MRALYTLNRAALLLLMVLYAPLVIVSVVGMAYGAYRLTMLAFQSFPEASLSGVRFFYVAVIGVIALDVTVLGVSLLLLVGLLPILFQEVVPEGGGMPLRRAEHRTLFQLIDGFCKRLRVRVPDAVYLTPFDHTGIADATVMAEDGTIRKRVRTLLLGAGLIVHLRADEFATVLCHELAHAATGDTRFSRIVSRFFNSMTEAIGLQHDEEFDRGVLDFAIGWALIGYYRVFALLYAIDARRTESRADRIAANVCGPQNVRNALMKTHLPQYLPELSIAALFVKYVESERNMNNLYQEHRDRWLGIPVSVRQRAENEMFLERHSVWSTHPCLSRRMRNLGNVEAKELTIDKSATRLFAKWSRLEEMITQELISWGRERLEEHINALDRELRSGRMS